MLAIINNELLFAHDNEQYHIRDFLGEWRLEIVSFTNGVTVDCNEFEEKFKGNIIVFNEMSYSYNKKGGEIIDNVTYNIIHKYGKNFIEIYQNEKKYDYYVIITDNLLLDGSDGCSFVYKRMIK